MRLRAQEQLMVLGKREFGHGDSGQSPMVAGLAAPCPAVRARRIRDDARADCYMS
jgi:hypothetical protein